MSDSPDAAPESGDDVTARLPIQSRMPDAVLSQHKGLGPPVGVFRAVPEDEYHAAPGLSSTDAKVIAHRSPAHYKAHKTEPRKETPAKTIGSALHIGILEPWSFDARVVRGLSVTRQSKVNKEKWAEFEREHAGKEIVPHASWDQLMATIDAVRSHPDAATFLAIGEAEQSVWWVDDEGVGGYDATHRLCKGRLDHYDPIAHNLIVDLKSAEDASYGAFQRQASPQGYDYALQDGWYRWGVERATGSLPDFVFCVFEKTPPYGVGFYEIPFQMREFTRTRMGRLLKTYSECMDSGEWPGYEPGVRVLEFPPWAYRLPIV